MAGSIRSSHNIRWRLRHTVSTKLCSLGRKKRMKKLLATLSVVLFAAEANADQVKLETNFAIY